MSATRVLRPRVSRRSAVQASFFGLEESASEADDSNGSSDDDDDDFKSDEDYCPDRGTSYTKKKDLLFSVSLKCNEGGFVRRKVVQAAKPSSASGKIKEEPSDKNFDSSVMQLMKIECRQSHLGKRSGRRPRLMKKEPKELLDQFGEPMESDLFDGFTDYECFLAQLTSDFKHFELQELLMACGLLTEMDGDRKKTNRALRQFFALLPYKSKCDKLELCEQLSEEWKQPKLNVAAEPYESSVAADNEAAKANMKMLEETGRRAPKQPAIGELRRNPSRRARAAAYNEYDDDDVFDDDFIYCGICHKMKLGECDKHKMIRVIDTEFVEDKVDPRTGRSMTRSRQSLPRCLAIGKSKIPNAGNGVWTEVAIARNYVFGPYVGTITMSAMEADNSYTWEILPGRYNSERIFVNGANEHTSNWMRYVNCARVEREQNLVAFQYQGAVYYRAFKDIAPFTELLTWYGSFGKDLVVVCPVDPHLDLLVIDKKSHPTTDLQGVFRCPHCENKCFSSDLFLLDHVRKQHRRLVKVHNNVQGQAHMNKCQYCDYTSNGKYLVRQHERQHTGDGPKCELCQKTFSTSQSLTFHRRIVHEKEKPFKCEFCQMAFATSQNLTVHRRTVHEKEKAFACGVCGKKLVSNQSLQYHMLKHAGQKPHACTYCDTRYRNLSSLREHERLVHLGKENVCEK